MTPQEILRELKDLPSDSVDEVWQLIEFIRYKNEGISSEQTVKLGGVLADYNVDITEDDISQARQEIQGNLGEMYPILIL